MYEYENYLVHHGIKDQRWGFRRFQYKDGSLTPEGKIRYGGQGNPTIGERIKARKVAKQRASNLEKARAAKAEKKRLEEEAKAFEERKARILASGNATELLSLQGQVSNEELEAAVNRLAKEKKIKETLETEIKKEEVKALNDEKARIISGGSAADVLSLQGKMTNTELQDAITRLEKEKTLKDMAASTVKSGWDKVDKFMERAEKVKNWGQKATEIYDFIAGVHNAFDDDQWKLINSKNDKKDDKKDKSNNKKLRDPAVEKLIRSGTNAQVLANLDKFTMEDINEFEKRLAMKERLQRKIKEEAEKSDTESSKSKTKK